MRRPRPAPPPGVVFCGALISGGTARNRHKYTLFARVARDLCQGSRTSDSHSRAAFKENREGHAQPWVPVLRNVEKELEIWSTWIGVSFDLARFEAMPSDNAPTIKRHDTLASELIPHEEIASPTTEETFDKSAASAVSEVRTRIACCSRNSASRRSSDILMHPAARRKPPPRTALRRSSGTTRSRLR